MKKWLQRFVIGIGLMVALTLLIVWGEWKYTKSQGQKRLAQVRAKLDAEEPGWRLEDMIAKHNASLPPDEENLAVVVERIMTPVFKSIDTWDSKAIARSFREVPNSFLMQSDDLMELKMKFKEWTVVANELMQSRKLTKGGITLHIENDDDFRYYSMILQLFRHSSTVLEYQSWIQQSKGLIDESLETGRAIFHMRLAHRNTPTSIHFLVASSRQNLAIKVVQRTLSMGVPARGLVEFQNELTEAMKEPNLITTLNGERALLNHLFELVNQGNNKGREIELSLFQLGSPSESPGYVQELFRTWQRKHQEMCQARMLEELNSLIEKTNHGIFGKNEALQHVYGSFPAANYQKLVEVYAASLQKVIQVEISNLGRIACAITAIACERFRQQTGRWPTTLDEIPKSILPEHPIDPKDGSPVKLVRTEHGLNVAVMGYDWVFHGGKKLGYRPDEDLGFELFDPEFRNRPPLPIENRDKDDSPFADISPAKKNPYVPPPLVESSPKGEKP